MADETAQEVNDIDSNSLQDIIGKYLPYWPIFIGLIVTGATFAYLQLRSATPIYQAHSTLMIKENEQQSAIIQQLNFNRGNNSITNEMALMHSFPIAKAVVDSLHLYASVTEEGRVRNGSAYTTSPVVFRMRNPEVLKETKDVPFTFNAANNTVTFDGHSYPLNQYVVTPYGEMMILPNKYATGYASVLPLHFSLLTPGNAAGVVLGNLSVSLPDDESSLISLTYNDESTQRAVDILNKLVAVYNVAAIEDKNKVAANTLRFLEERLKYVKADLDSVEQKRENFRSANRIVDISSQGQQYLGTVSGNDARVANIDIQLSVLNEVQQYVQSKRSGDALVPAGITDPILNGQLSALAQAETQQAALQRTTGENYPELSSITAQINRIRPTILENIRNQRQNLLTTRSDLQGNSGRYNSLLSGLPSQERTLLNINRQQEITNTIYKFLLQKREDAELAFASQVSDSRTVNDAQITGIVSPIPKNVYLQSIIISLIIGVLFVFVRENLNRNVKSRAELEKLTKVPVIADIVQDKAKESIVVQAGSRTMIAEQFRYLRTALNYVGIDAAHKKILFTSSISGEGKSFITTNLAATLALTGKKVIMLEMDLRKPKLSEMMGMDRSNGLSDYLIGAKPLSEIIKPTVVNNLFLISSGAIPPNPSELLTRNELPQLLSSLEKDYDYILIDTAPVSPVTDAFIISPLCDATIYVVRQGRSPRVLVRRINDLAKSKRLKNISVVLNGVKVKRFGSYYGYGYTYGYGYGYLDEKKGKKKKATT